MRRRRWLAPLLLTTVLAAVLLAAGCSVAGTPTPAGVVPVAPQPVGATVVAVPPPVPPPVPPGGGTGGSVGASGQTGDCDPTASLRPGGLPAPGAMPARSTMARIVARGRLTVGVDQNTYLFGFRNPSSGALEGFDIDVAREVARALFGDPDRITFRVIASADRIPALQHGDVDLVVRTMTITCDRLEQIDFSTVYYQSGQRVLVPQGSPAHGIGDLGGRRVCAAQGSTSIGAVAAAPSRPVPVQVENWTDCLVMLQQGQVDAISTDDTILAGLAAQDPTVTLVGAPFTAEPYGIGVPKGNEDLVRFVNAVLDRMRGDRTWVAIYRRWLGSLGPTPAPPPARYRD